MTGGGTGGSATGGGTGRSSSCISSMFLPNVCPEGKALAGTSGGLASSRMSKGQGFSRSKCTICLDCLCRLLIW